MKITPAFLKKNQAPASLIGWYLTQDTTDAARLLDVAVASEDAVIQSHANWLLSHLFNRRQKVQYILFAAELVLDLQEQRYLDDKKTRELIGKAKQYLRDPDITFEEDHVKYSTLAKYMVCGMRTTEEFYAAEAAFNTAAYAASLTGKEQVSTMSKILQYGLKLFNTTRGVTMKVHLKLLEKYRAPAALIDWYRAQRTRDIEVLFNNAVASEDLETVSHVNGLLIMLHSKEQRLKYVVFIYELLVDHLEYCYVKEPKFRKALEALKQYVAAPSNKKRLAWADASHDVYVICSIAHDFANAYANSAIKDMVGSIFSDTYYVAATAARYVDHAVGNTPHTMIKIMKYSKELLNSTKV